ncbi:unnamed protein product [Polarella glacialis]|uniref:Peptidase C14 caspase domain-containing protein n=1 Tax=Polarella glacialis TaxID=89957 RepID=A0A813FQ36_POLGL|nr:unnamed protein product [Polarella glacialis]CAE8689211.1 unnamed protein product [Polarella glacialis]
MSGRLLCCCCPSMGLVDDGRAVFVISVHMPPGDASSSSASDAGGNWPGWSSMARLLPSYVSSFSSDFHGSGRSKGGMCTQVLLAVMRSVETRKPGSWRDVTFEHLLASMQDLLRPAGLDAAVLTVRSSGFLSGQYLGAAFPLSGAPDPNNNNSRSSIRRALLIGACYPGSELELRGSWNDCEDMHDWLVYQQLFGLEQVRVLTDRPGSGSRELPTRRNVLAQLRWLFSASSSRKERPDCCDASLDEGGGHLFLHFSGHGDNGELLPSDWADSGPITEKQLADIVARELPTGVTLTCVFDCCDSSLLLHSLSHKLQIGGG